MNKQTARNMLVVLGLWTFSRVIAWVVKALFIVVNSRMTYTGDVGTVTMWLWEGFPDELVAALVAITLVWVIETRKPLAWVGALAVLYLYSGGLNAWRLLTHGWRIPPRTPDYIGILTQAIIPMLACLAAGIWGTRRFVTPRQPSL
jgi:hypothetical protein